MSKPQNLHKSTHLKNHFIYYNLHKRCWSLKSTESNEAGPLGVFAPSVKGRVTGHADTVLAVRITCKVSESGRQRVILEKRKNVHAGIVATTCIAQPRGNFPTSDLTRSMSYNPYKRGEFYDRATGRTVTDAPYALLRSGCDGYPPRVFYGDKLYYAIWADEADSAENNKYNGFLSDAELSRWIGLSEFTGIITCNGRIKYNCRDGKLEYAG